MGQAYTRSIGLPSLNDADINNDDDDVDDDDDDYYDDSEKNSIIKSWQLLHCMFFFFTVKFPCTDITRNTVTLLVPAPCLLSV